MLRPHRSKLKRPNRMAPQGPVRSCVACRSKRPQHDLLRVAIAPDGSITLDAGPHRTGRGAYVCRDRHCVEGAVKHGVLARRLRGGSISVELERRLLDEVEKRTVHG